MTPSWGLVALMLACLAAPAAAVPLEVYGRLPTVALVDISPDGKSLAIITTGVEGNQLQIRQTADLGLKTVVRLGLQKVTGTQWTDPDHVIVITESATEVAGLRMPRRDRFFQANLVDLNSGKVTDLLGQVGQDSLYETRMFLNVIVAWPQRRTVDGQTQIFLPGVVYTDTGGSVAMYSQGYGVGRAKLVEKGGADTFYMMVDNVGRPIAREDYNSESGDWTLQIKAANGWRKAHSVTAKLDPPSLEGFGATERTLMVWQHEDNGDRYREFTIDSGSWSEPIASLDDTILIKDPVKRTTLGGVDTGHMKVRHVFLDPADQQIWGRVERAFPGEIVKLRSWSDDRSKLVLQVTGARSGNAFYLLDLAARSASPIAEQYAGIGNADLNEVKAISYAAQDGLTIPAFLTLPRHAPAKNLPLVVLAHGGPVDHDEPGFDWLAQSIASLGYAVLQPQFRGSSGFGQRFREAGYGQWGRKMQTDLSDGIKNLATQGIVDPGRVCIAGMNYGGYAAMAGVALQSGVYRCAVSYGGMSNLSAWLERVQSDTSSKSISMRYWKRFMGAKDAGDPSLDEISPVKQADKISAPLLLIHGEIDTVVDPEQSRLMLAAAQRAGKPVRLITLKGEDHDLARGATRLQMLQATADFLKANLPAGATGETAAR